MGNLLANATAVGFGPQVAITSKFTGFDVSGLADGWFVSIYYSQTDVSTDFIQVVEPAVNPTGKSSTPPNYLRIKNNGPANFSYLPAQGNIRAFLEGGRSDVTVNMDLLTEA